MASLDQTELADHDERVSMTTPDPDTTGQPAAGKPAAGDSQVGQGAWAAVFRLLALQLLTVIAVTAVITGIYALADPHNTNNRATARSAAGATATSAAATGTPPASAPPTSPPASPPSAAAPASPTATQRQPEGAKRLKVDVFNQSGTSGRAAKMAARVRALGWTVGRVSDFRGDVSATTVYYPSGEAKAARELADALPGKPRVLARFSTLADNRLSIVITR
jgi:cytoskeletal protein RodZ